MLTRDRRRALDLATIRIEAMIDMVMDTQSLSAPEAVNAIMDRGMEVQETTTDGWVIHIVDFEDAEERAYVVSQLPAWGLPAPV